MVGYVLMHRDMMDWEWYQSPNVSRLYFHLIFKVNFKDKKWQGNQIKRGQLITSNNNLSAELMLSIQTIRTALQKLQDGGYVKVETTNRFTLITLVNYDKFQLANPETNKQTATQGAIKKQSKNKPVTATKESKKENKLKNETIEIRRIKFKKQVFALSGFNIKILDSFFNYWSELNIDRTKMRFESERFFEIDKRMKKWILNEKKITTTSNHKNILLTNR